MKLVFTSILLLTSIMISCSPKVNRKKNDLKHGKWRIIEKPGDSIIEHYRHGVQHGLSKQYISGRLYKKERQHRRRSTIKFYHTNGKISSRGWSAMDDNPKYLRWYYTGTWKYFDEAGKLVEIRVYEKGFPIIERMIYKGTRAR